MKINNNLKQNISFKGPLDGAITKALSTINTNAMANAALVDTFAMVLPRTYVDTKKRNKYAGAETFFREATGTVIVCLSAGTIAKGIAKIYNRLIDKNTNVNPNLWITDNSFDLLNHSWKKSEGNVQKYVKNIFSNISGADGQNINHWKDINWENVQWFNDKNWDNIKWESPSLNGIQHRLKNDKQIINITSDFINSENAHKNDVKNILKIIEHRISNALGVNSSIDIKLDDKLHNTSLKNIIRDTYHLGKELFKVADVDLVKTESKLKAMNKTKNLGAIGIAAGLGLLDQYINRKITKKRTGTDNFVGEVDYGKKEALSGAELPFCQQNNDDKMKFTGLKVLSSLGILGLALAVMKIKSPSQFIKKLEFTGLATSGNTIKTIYTATLIGRFLAAKNKTELRESATRDYLGFLNWLVLGGFISKGVGQLIFDKNMKTLFNTRKKGNGIAHWLNEISPKSHAEIAAKGAEFAKQNMWKINLMHVSGLLYSTLALGFAIPLLNIFLTKRKEYDKKQESQFKNFNSLRAWKNPNPQTTVQSF